VSAAQGFLLFLILLGGVATVLRLVDRTTPTVPYPVLLAAGGIVVGLIPGLGLPPIGPELILLVFVPGLVFEAALTLDLPELWRRIVPVSLLATAGVFITVVAIGALAHYGLGFSWAAGFLLGAIVAATDPIAVVTLLRELKAPPGLTAILEGESLFNDGTGVAVFAAVLGTILSGHPSVADAGLRFVFVTIVGAAIGLAVGFATGYFQLRSAVPAYEVRRDEGVEWLFPGREAVFVYRFRGGLPKCWAQVGRPSGPETLFLDPKPAAAQGPAPRTPPDEVEGLVALVGPTGKDDPYSLHVVVTKLAFPEGRRPPGAAATTATYWTGPKPGGPKPSEPAGQGYAVVDHRQSPDLQPGQDIELTDTPVGPRGGPLVRVKMWLRFYTPEELATAEPQPGGGA
jgi:hypothetical protein